MHRRSISSTTAARTSPPTGLGRFPRRRTERVCGEITFSTAARPASIMFGITIFLSLCGGSPSFAQQADNWMRDHVQARVLERNLRAAGAQEGRIGGERLQAIVRPRVVGGVPATPTDNPFQVALLTKSIANNDDAQYCGGSLVRSNFVVTAAHCSDFVSANEVQVLTGTQDLDGTGVRRDVLKITIHPAWNPSTMDSDVAVWQLSSDATGIVLATLATEDGAVGDDLLATGWGATEAGPPPIHLQAVLVPLVSEENCNDEDSYNGDVTDTMLCAGLDVGGQDTCQGDSGGPLTRGPGNTVLTGLTSWGIGCADPNFFGVYTRVSNPAISSFIEETLISIPTPVGASCSLCYTCGGNWPTFAGQIGQDTASGPVGLNAPATERGWSCSDPLAPSSDTAPYLCCGQ
jgi:Trypsin